MTAKLPIFRSFYEKNIYTDLKARRVTFSYETVKLKYERPATVHTYTPDFPITTKSRKVILVEAKGYFDAANRKKMELVKASNPTLDIRFLFQEDKPIRKGSKTYYTDWATKRGFPWHVGSTVPESWINE
jgi:predicted nuclease of restriction endonuclease-like RecB superfamily